MSRTTNFTAVPLIDALLGNRDGSTRQILFDDLAAQLAGSGAVYNALEDLKSALGGGGVEYADTKGDLEGAAGTAGDVGFVLRDPTSLFNGIYQHTGALWQKVVDLPDGWVALSASDVLALYEDNADTNRLTDALLEKLQGLPDDIQQGIASGGSVFRTEAPGALSTTLTGDAADRPVYDGGSVQAISGYGKARVVTGADIAAAGTSLKLAFTDLIPVYPDKLTHVEIYVGRTVDAADPANHAVTVGFNRLLAGKQIAAETIVEQITDLVVVDAEDLGAGVRKIEFSVTKGGDFADVYDLADNVSYINPFVEFHGPGGDHAVAWIAQVVSDHTHALLPDDRDHLVSDAERADIAADKARIGGLEAQQRHRIIPRPLTGESGIAVYDRDGLSVAFPQYRIEEYKETGYAPTFSVDGGTFTYAGGNDTSVLAIDLDTHDWVETDLDTASDLTRYLTVFEMSPSGISAARGLPIVEKENTDTTELITSYDPAMDVILTQPQTTVDQYEPRFVHTEADAVWFAPAARQGQKIILRQGAVFDLTSVPMGVTVEFHCSAAAALYAGLSHEDESQIGFDDMDDGGDPALPLNYATLTAGQWGFISRPEPGVIKLAWMDRDAPPMFTNIDHPIADLHIVGAGQSPNLELRNKGGLCGLQRGLVTGFRMTNPGDGESEPFLGTLYYSPAALGGSCVDSRNTSGDGYYRNGSTGAFDGAAAIEFRRVIDLAHARGQPCPDLIEPWWGAADITGMVALNPDTPPTDISQLSTSMVACFEDMRNYITSKEGWNDLPDVALPTVQLNEKGLASDDSVAATREDVTTRVRAMQLELINDPTRPWILQGVSNWAFCRRPGQAHHTYDGNDRWGYLKAPSIGNLCLGQQNDFQSSLESWEIAEDRGSVTFTFTEPLGQKFRTPSGIGGGHYSTAPAPFLIGILNAARQIIPATLGQWISDRTLLIWVDLPVEGVKTSAIFPYGADQRPAMGLDYPGTIVSRGGEFDPASGLYHIAARDFFIEEL